MRCSITNRASFVRSYAVALAAVCLVTAIGGDAVEQPPIRLPGIGDIVFDVLGLEIAASPGAAPSRRLRGSPGLVVEIHAASQSRTWYRLLGADGLYGWSPLVPRHLLPSHIDMGETTFVVLDRSPDDPSFEENVRAIEVSGKGTIAGASSKSRIPSLQQLMFPARLNPFDTPWLKAHIGPITGWSPPSELWLSWGEPPILMPEGHVAAMKRLGLSGLVRAPFLGPIKDALRHVAPRQDEAVLLWSDDTSKPKQAIWTSGDWGDAELLIQRAKGHPKSISTMVVLARGRTRAFTFIAANGKLAHAVIESYPPTVVDYVWADLNGDGFIEWLIETGQIYGDGYYSTLWIVDGRSLVDALRIDTIELGGSSGESGSVDVDAFWWIDSAEAGKALRIWRVQTSNDSTKAVSFAYHRDRVSRSDVGGGVFVVIAAEASTYLEARQKSLALARQTNWRFPVFAVRKNGVQPWVAGRIFERRREADTWRQTFGDSSALLRIIELPVGFKD